jgi:membrane associated rhomboid family serine protease
MINAAPPQQGRSAGAPWPGNGLLLPAGALMGAALVVQVLGEPAHLALRYERTAIVSCEWWRLVSAHLVHLGWAHLALNAAALLMIAVLLGEQFTANPGLPWP